MKKNKSLKNSKVEKQIIHFVSKLRAYNRKKEFPQEKRAYELIQDFFIRFVKDRNSRAEEVNSSEYQNILQLAKKQFPVPLFWNLCMDGRVLAVLMNGATAKVGSSIRVPGGILREFVRGEDGRLRLISDSNFSKLLHRLLIQQHHSKVAEIFDSHIGCAARLAEEQAHGNNPSDHGLFQDVLYKKQMSHATKHFIEKEYRGRKEIIIIQTSFNPRNGFLYMGLETDGAIQYGLTKGSEYTYETLEALIADKKIISTQELAQSSLLHAQFEKYNFRPDWKLNYVDNAKSYWNAIASMKDDVLPYIQERISVIYPTISRDELNSRAIILLTNAFSGFLHNYNYDGPSKSYSEHDISQHYPYGIHKEEGIKVSEGGFPPYVLSMFVVFSLDEKNLTHNIELAASLVRSNRLEGRIEDRAGLYTNKVEFSKAPVPVIVQEIVRFGVTDEEWKKLSNIEWNDLPATWNIMSDASFTTYLQSKGVNNLSAALGINNLRRRMAVLFDRENPTASHLVENYKIALPVIIGGDRYTHFVVPFIKLGL